MRPEPFIQVSPTVRVENGPARKRAVATKELLSTMAAFYKIGGRDELGKVIMEKEEFNYLDWNGDWVWYVYQINPETGRYLPKGISSDKRAALAHASSLNGTA